MELQAAVEEQPSVVIDTPPTTAESSETANGGTGAPGEKQSDENDSVGGVTAPKRLPTKADFPPLSSVVYETAKVSWGPNMKKPESQSGSILSSVASIGSVGAKPLRSKVIQEAFSLDLQSQLSISKPEFSKLLMKIKEEHRVSIESTLSRNSRTFLISGVPTKVYNAKRDLVKKLTVPINTVIHVPSKTVSIIIGPGGKMINSITSETGVSKIDILKTPDEDSYDSDLDDTTMSISLHGDVASVNLAKEKIMAIVDEEIKSVVINVIIDDQKLIPFVSVDEFEVSSEVSVKFQPEQSRINISGPREEVKVAKVKAQNYLNTLSSTIVEKKIPIPTKFQPLIDADQIKQKYHVIVIFPTAVGEQNVTFIGLGPNVDEAIEFARKSSKSFVVESLEISKAHGRNIPHAKDLVLYFTKYNPFSDLEAAHNNVKIVLPSPEEVVTLEQVNVNIISKAEFSEDIKVVRRRIINIVNDLTPEHFLSIDDLDYALFHVDIKRLLSCTEIPFVQMGDFYPGDNRILLVQKVVDEEFKPTAEELRASLIKASSVLDTLRAKQEKLSKSVISIPAEKQDQYLQEGTTTYSLLMEDVGSKSGNLQIKLHNPSPSEVTLRGEENAVAVASKILTDISENSEPVKLSFSIPSSTAPKLIGSMGSNFSEIRKKFGIKINIPQDSGNNTTEVVVSGLPYNAERAKDYILAEVKKWADITSKELVVPQEFIAQLVGPQRVNLTRLSTKYSVSIQMPKDGEVFTIRGPSKGVNKAYKELKALLEFEIENGQKTFVNVPLEHVKRVIGKNGEMIKSLSAEYDVLMNFEQHKDGKSQESGNVKLEIVGSEKSIKQAAKRVEAFVAEAADMVTKTVSIDQKYHKDLKGRGLANLKDIISKAGGDNLRFKNINFPMPDSDDKTSVIVSGPSNFVEKAIKLMNSMVSDLKESIVKEVDIPKDRHGSLIGTGGAVRKRLEAIHNVRLVFPEKDENLPIKIYGKPKAIAECEKEIFNEIIRKGFDKEIPVPVEYHEFVSKCASLINKLGAAYHVIVKYPSATREVSDLTRIQHKVPREKVVGATGEGYKFTVEEYPYPALSGKTIPWRLSYQELDLSDILGEDKTKKTETSKEKSLDAAVSLIKERIDIASKSTYVGYLWCEQQKNTNKAFPVAWGAVKQIGEATTTQIIIPDKSDQDKSTIYIRGTKDAVEQAGKMIISELKN
ncbi:HBR424Wp [Eremothecium sinecaudum]|uniref:HBR424Wp n=1 Tax=Eremothecium sinecaudum TaxID=45286 RepID=A0A109UXJ3_9SACH|nr:HBR424Wp [Eremothecium sinecaudum]AMD19325.1 HBR424Wp [Eremothecium sinecaudum]